MFNVDQHQFAVIANYALFVLRLALPVLLPLIGLRVAVAFIKHRINSRKGGGVAER